MAENQKHWQERGGSGGTTKDEGGGAGLTKGADECLIWVRRGGRAVSFLIFGVEWGKGDSKHGD